jgi:hypothetical protein
MAWLKIYKTGCSQGKVVIFVPKLTHIKEYNYDGIRNYSKAVS